LPSSRNEASPRLSRVDKKEKVVEKASTWSSAVPLSPRGQCPLAIPRAQSPSPTPSPRTRGQCKRTSREKKDKKVKKTKGDKANAEESDDVITLLIIILSNCSAHGTFPCVAILSLWGGYALRAWAYLLGWAVTSRSGKAGTGLSQGGVGHRRLHAIAWRSEERPHRCRAIAG
jgi:hypothetical protein